MSANRIAPDDDACSRAWDEIMSIARKHCLVVKASGGMATLATPERQRQAGIRDAVLRMHLAAEPSDMVVDGDGKLVPRPKAMDADAIARMLAGAGD